MRVFILSTGRCGSYTIIQACKHIKNFTAAHESRTQIIGKNRLNYPDNHIESDNRLSWFLGPLDKKFGDDAFYVHLIRNKQDTVDSLNKRWNAYISINKAFVRGILNKPIEKTTQEQRRMVCEQYYDTVNSNISLFLEEKNHKMTMHLETISNDFETFWDFIGAEGNLEKAKIELTKKHNKSVKKRFDLRYRLKLHLLSLKNRIN